MSLMNRFYAPLEESLAMHYLTITALSALNQQHLWLAVALQKQQALLELLLDTHLSDQKISTLQDCLCVIEDLLQEAMVYAESCSNALLEAERKTGTEKSGR
jgi:hypothetical protein